MTNAEQAKRIVRHIVAHMDTRAQDIDAVEALVEEALVAAMLPPEPPQDIVRVLRLVEYEGPRALVEKQVEQSVHGTRFWGPHQGIRITAVTLGGYPQVLDEARQVPEPKLIRELQAEIARLRGLLALQAQEAEGE